MKGSEFITATEFVRKSVACPGKFGRFGLAFSKKGTAQEKKYSLLLPFGKYIQESNFYQGEMFFLPLLLTCFSTLNCGLFFPSPHPRGKKRWLLP